MVVIVHWVDLVAVHIDSAGYCINLGHLCKVHHTEKEVVVSVAAAAMKVVVETDHLDSLGDQKYLVVVVVVEEVEEFP